MNMLTIDLEEAALSLRAFIQDTVSGAGFANVVLGLSGGVDSALAAYLSAQALGPEHVLALRLPYENSAEESMSLAQQVIEDTGIRSDTYSITAGVDGVLDDFPQADKVRKGNVMARMRMIYLYDQAKALQGLVVGTGNKTETLLGYSTLHGDAAFDLNPLGDLYKTQVWALAEHLGVPQKIIDRPPTAGLWAGQTDEEELGFSYQEADKLLFLLVEKDKTMADCQQVGFEERFIQEVVERVKRYRFKSTLPPVGSVGQQPLAILDQRPWFRD